MGDILPAVGASAAAIEAVGQRMESYYYSHPLKLMDSRWPALTERIPTIGLTSNPVNTSQACTYVDALHQEQVALHTIPRGILEDAGCIKRAPVGDCFKYTCTLPRTGATVTNSRAGTIVWTLHGEASNKGQVVRELYQVGDVALVDNTRTKLVDAGTAAPGITLIWLRQFERAPEFNVENEEHEWAEITAGWMAEDWVLRAAGALRTLNAEAGAFAENISL